ENPQARYGIDIISRASLAISDEEINNKLRELVIESINSLINKIAKSSGLDPIDIDAAVVAGNTVMTQLFLGIRLNSLVQSPYIPAIGLPIVLRASDIGLTMNPAAPIFIMPAVAGFIGGDAVADALVANLDEKNHRLLIDIGTNTEVMLRTDDNILAASAPAGSAIEGVGISSGVRAVEGAIDKVELVDGELRAFTIGGGAPIGITGTGLIDLVAALMKAGSISRNGRLIPGRFVVESNSSLVVSINGVTVTQRDIRLLQEAKAAIQSTWKTLLRVAGISESELDTVYVAGSFGTHINPDSAISIGLLPQAKIFFLGNAAISGAKLILRNEDYWDKTTRVVKMIKVIEMAALDDYEKIFLESTMLGR
ncbi:MAG: ASKHA domain-containing protein, partial [Thermocladium sp.]